MNKVLIIAYSFPPVGGAGVQRPVKFVKYLRKFGWEPVVLTVENPSVPTTDEALLRDIPEGVKIYRARSLEPSYASKQTFSNSETKIGVFKSLLKKYISIVLLPDLQILWWPGLVIKLVKVIKKEKPHCLYVTAPPFSSFLPVVVLGKIFRIPVILDYRDEWVFSRNSWENASKSKFAYFMDTKFEKFALLNCSAFITATQSYVDSIVKYYGSEFISKGQVITNGYDADDFIIDTKRRIITESDIVTIVYTGTVWKATSLNVFCSALENYIVKNPGMKKRVRVKVFGRVVEDERHYLESEIFKGVLEIYGYIEHEKVVEEMINADILLLTLSDLPGAEKIIHGKVFEYMASGRHIFALIPDGEVKQLLTDNYNSHTIVNPTDFNGANTSLENIIIEVERLRNGNKTDVSCFLREVLTEKLALVLNNQSK